jgi:hypothetical protein
MRSSSTRSPPAHSLELFIVLPHTLSDCSQYRCARSPSTHSLAMRTLWRCSGRSTLYECSQSHCEQSPTTAHALWLYRFMVRTFWQRTISRRTHWTMFSLRAKTLYLPLISLCQLCDYSISPRTLFNNTHFHGAHLWLCNFTCAYSPTTHSLTWAHAHTTHSLHVTPPSQNFLLRALWLLLKGW